MVACALLVGEVFRVGGTAMDHVGLSGIGTVAPHPGLRPVQQIGQDLGVVHVRQGRHHRMDELGLTVHPDVGLHPEIPLVSFLGLMHLGVARLGLIFSGTRRVDDRGIDDGAAGDAQATGGEVRIHQRKDLFTETVRLQPVAELACPWSRRARPRVPDRCRRRRAWRASRRATLRPPDRRD